LLVNYKKCESIIAYSLIQSPCKLGEARAICEEVSAGRDSRDVIGRLFLKLFGREKGLECMGKELGSLTRIVHRRTWVPMQSADYMFQST
jgi:hypothetical protein